MKELYDTEDEKKQYLAIIHNELRRMTTLIEDLFELSKMDIGEVNLHLENVDLTEVLENVYFKTKLKAEAKGLKMEVDVKADLPLVQGDGFRLEQIFLNLVENAIRYTEKGEIAMRSFTKGQRVITTVTDTGLVFLNADGKPAS